jgi:thiamine biosynthesis lipoprotein
LGQLISLWEQSQGVVKLDEAIHAQVLNQLQADSVKLDAEQRSIAIDSAVKFVPDAYAKGYIIDRALVAARQAVPSIEGLLVDIGVTFVFGVMHLKRGLKIGAQDAFVHNDNSAPQQVLNLNDQRLHLVDRAIAHWWTKPFA